MAVNNDKTQIMCLASKRKRAAMAAKREACKIKITVEGHKIEEMEHRKVLGFTWNRDLSGKKNAEMLAERFSTKLNTVSRVPKYLTKDRKITLVEGRLISQIRCGIEITTGGNDQENTTMKPCQEKSNHRRV